VDPRACVACMERRKIFRPCRKSNAESSVFHLGADSLYRLRNTGFITPRENKLSVSAKKSLCRVQLNDTILQSAHLLVVRDDSSDVLIYRGEKKLNSVAVVRKRTIPTERPPLVGEVVCMYVCARVGQRLALAPRPLMTYCASPFRLALD
jgi:hypothetical protein